MNMTLMEALKLYIERFDEGPPIAGFEEYEAIILIAKALADGEPIKQGAEAHIPKDAIV